MSKVVTFGEIMLRLATPGNLRFSQTDSLTATYGGGEANVAVSLANYGVETDFVTRLPENDIAAACVAELRKRGVGTSQIVYGGERLGIYFLETGAISRPSKVVYDRAHSSISTIEVGMIDWEAVFQDADWFHWTGITPAISASAAEVCLEACKVANRMGITVSCDLNYRKNLWKYGKTAGEVLPALMEGCDIVFGTELEYKQALGVDMPAFKAVDTAYEMPMEGYKRAADEIAARLPHCHTIVFALRNVIHAQHHLLGGTLWHRGEIYSARIFDIEGVVDCVGVGDAYNAGIIYGMRHDCSMQRSLDLGAAACALKNTVPGDYAQFPIEEIMAVADGNTNGRVQR